MNVYEANFDGLVGLTHNYSGLSSGNLASIKYQNKLSNPKKAALQGLFKMKTMHDMGLVQGVLAPQMRPDLNLLRQLGFSGSDINLLNKVSRYSPSLLSVCYSAASMWTANAATVSPSADTQDGKVHFTPANLVSKLHRSIEHPTTGRLLKSIFNNDEYFCHHSALPSVYDLGDEGAANHTRFCVNYDQAGVAFFVYGRSALQQGSVAPKKYIARQTLEASQSIARQHNLLNKNVVYAQQNPEVIDKGVFHNDVIAVGNKQVLFCHEKAYVDQQNVYQQLNQSLNGQLQVIEVPESAVSVEDAVQSYLFNSQLITLNDNDMALMVPLECQNNSAVDAYLNQLVTMDNAIKQVKVFDLRQSMNNGGGPACLRLRVVLTEDELQAVNPYCLLSDDLYWQLETWINKYYRDQLSVEDLADPELLKESRQALDELTKILHLGNVYQF